MFVPGRIAQRAKLAAQEARERARLLRIGEQRAEDLILREEHRASRLAFVHACATPRRGNRLTFTRPRDEQHGHQRDGNHKEIREVGET